MSFVTIFFIFAGVWLGAHLWFGTVNNELWDTFDSLRDNQNPMLWFTSMRTIITFEYSVLDTNWFFQIVRGILIICGISFYILAVAMIWRVVSYIFSGFAQILSGFRRGRL